MHLLDMLLGSRRLLAWAKESAGCSEFLLPVVCSLLAFMVYALALAAYRLFWHPLAKIPGPRLQALMYLPWLYRRYVGATAPLKALELHQKYGPVVRVTPSEVIVDGAIGWPQVFGYTNKDKQEFPKAPGFFFKNDHKSIVNAPREHHRRIRRQLSRAFSDNAMAEQESILVRYTDMLIERLQELSDQGAKLNIVDWLNFTTFDIIGELAFSDPFDSLTSKDYHPWVLSIFQSIQASSLRRFLTRYPPLHLIVDRLGLSKGMKVQTLNRQAAVIKTQKRMAFGVDGPTGRKDFATHMMQKSKTGDNIISAEEMLSTFPVLVIAGSETTGTALAGLFFFLSRHPEKTRVLVDELRSAYATEGHITMDNTSKLEYLHATLEETMRIYPPVLMSPPRVSPGANVGDYYIPKGTQLTVHQWATYHNPDHFLEPNEFHPERWLAPSHALYDARFANDNRAVFKPFSYGIRDCIGRGLAYREMRLVASRVLYRFDVLVDEDQANWLQQQKMLGMWIKPPLMVTLKRRQ